MHEKWNHKEWEAFIWGTGGRIGTIILMTAAGMATMRWGGETAIGIAATGLAISEMASKLINGGILSTVGRSAANGGRAEAIQEAIRIIKTRQWIWIPTAILAGTLLPPGTREACWIGCISLLWEKDAAYEGYTAGKLWEKERTQATKVGEITESAWRLATTGILGTTNPTTTGVALTLGRPLTKWLRVQAYKSRVKDVKPKRDNREVEKMSLEANQQRVLIVIKTALRQLPLILATAISGPAAAGTLMGAEKVCNIMGIGTQAAGEIEKRRAWHEKYGARNTILWAIAATAATLTFGPWILKTILHFENGSTPIMILGTAIPARQWLEIREAQEQKNGGRKMREAWTLGIIAGGAAALLGATTEMEGSTLAAIIVALSFWTAAITSGKITTRKTQI